MQAQLGWVMLCDGVWVGSPPLVPPTRPQVVALEWPRWRQRLGPAQPALSERTGYRWPRLIQVRGHQASEETALPCVERSHDHQVGCASPALSGQASC